MRVIGGWSLKPDDPDKDVEIKTREAITELFYGECSNNSIREHTIKHIIANYLFELQRQAYREQIKLSKMFEKAFSKRR